jgi:hypothetical protein
MLCRWHNPSLGMTDIWANILAIAFFVFLGMDLYELWRKP